MLYFLSLERRNVLKGNKITEAGRLLTEPDKYNNLVTKSMWQNCGGKVCVKCTHIDKAKRNKEGSKERNKNNRRNETKTTTNETTNRGRDRGQGVPQ